MVDLYRLVYTSRNLLGGSEADRVAVVAEILAKSQHNNGKVDVTGALLFNGGSFAQVLEGPRAAVETIFERIQRDPRHSDVSVLQCEPVAERGFPNWSMAFIGHSARGRALWNDIAGRTGFELGRIDGDGLFATLHAIVTEEEGVAAGAVPATASPPPRREPIKPRSEALDVERIRAELRERAPEERPAGVQAGVRPSAAPRAAEPVGAIIETAPGTEAAVLRSALAEERGRTTELRRSLDEARVALALASDEVDTLRRHRDIWAERAKALASALCRDPADAGAAENDQRIAGPTMVRRTA